MEETRARLILGSALFFPPLPHSESCHPVLYFLHFLTVVTRWLRVVYDTRRLSAHGTQRRNTAESTHKTATAIAVTAFTKALRSASACTRFEEKKHHPGDPSFSTFSTFKRKTGARGVTRFKGRRAIQAKTLEGWAPVLTGWWLSFRFRLLLALSALSARLMDPPHFLRGSAHTLIRELDMELEVS